MCRDTDTEHEEDLPDFIMNPNIRGLSATLKENKSNPRYARNGSRNFILDRTHLFLWGFVMWWCVNYETAVFYSSCEACKQCNATYQGLLHCRQKDENESTSKSKAEEDTHPSFWYHALVALHLKNIISWIFQNLPCIGSHVQTIPSVKKCDHFNNGTENVSHEVPAYSNDEIRQESLHSGLTQTHDFEVTDLTDNKCTGTMYMIEIPVLDSSLSTSTEENRIPATVAICNLSPENGKYTITVVRLDAEGTECKNSATRLNISVDEVLHITLVVRSVKICVIKISKFSKCCKQFKYCCVIRDVLLSHMINFRSKSKPEKSPVEVNANSVVEITGHHDASYVDHEDFDSPTDCLFETSREINHGDGDSLHETRSKEVASKKKLELKQSSTTKSRWYFGCFVSCAKKIESCLVLSANSIKKTFSYAKGKTTATSQRCGAVNRKVSQDAMVEILFRLHQKLKDCYVKDIYRSIDVRTRNKIDPAMTQNSIHTNSVTSCVTNSVSTQSVSDDDFLSKTCHSSDLTIENKSALAETSNGKLDCRIYQEVPEEQKLLQPPEFNSRNKSHRISTLINKGVIVPNCSIEDVCDAGFYLGQDGSMHCFRCQVTFPVEEFYPSDPHHPAWHGRACNGSFSRTQSDGRICDDARDPPGQQSVYIPSGDVRDERYRLSTFAKYPVSSSVSKVNLAKAGFCYTGFSDKVRCFSCGRMVEHWEAQDNPMSAIWHKSSCPMPRGAECGNIPMQSQFHTNTSPRSCNQGTIGLQSNYVPVGSASHSRGARVTPRPNVHHQQPSPLNTAPVSQRPKQWRMASVVSADHRRYLNNLYLNRELDRLASFARWPTGRPTVSPESLAKAGFFYLGDADRTQCFSCGGVLRNWTASDTPHLEHSHNFPQCQMVQGIETHNVPVPMHPESCEERERNFPCRHPTNPHMRSEATRLETFERRWPLGRVQATPEEISNAGFFFLGERDRTKCWYCNGGLQNWDYDDSPWEEHAKWFPNCQFLLRMKGQNFVYRHLAGNAHLQRPIIAQQEGSAIDQTSPGQAVAPSSPGSPDVPPSFHSRNTGISQSAASPTIIDPRKEIRKRKELVQNAMTKSDIVKNIITMGFDREIIEALLENKVAAGKQANNEDIYDSMSELLNDVMEKEKEEEEKKQRAAQAAAAQPTPSYNNSYYIIDDEDDDDAMNMYGSTEGATAHGIGSEVSFPGRSNISSLQDRASMQEAMDKIEEDSLCKICFSNKADMVFLPCSHLCCCMDCTQAIRQCPLCRKTIDKAIKVYEN